MNIGIILVAFLILIICCFINIKEGFCSLGFFEFKRNQYPNEKVDIYPDDPQCGNTEKDLNNGECADVTYLSK